MTKLVVRRVILAFSLLFLCPTFIYGADFSVNSILDQVDLVSGDGVCATESESCTLRAAVQEANALEGEDTIQLPAGFFALTLQGQDENAAATGDLDITDALVLMGAGAGVTVVDGSSFDRVVQVFIDTNVQISDLTIQGGRIGTLGGGVYNEGSLGMVRVEVTRNVANAGGGIRNGAPGILVIDQCSIAGNAVYDFGFTNPRGGGIENKGELIVTNSSFADNLAPEPGSGSALRNETGSASVSNTTIVRNGPEGIDVINNLNADLDLRNVTIAYNEGPSVRHSSFDGSEELRLQNVILFADGYVNCAGDPPVSLGYNLSNYNTCGLNAEEDLSRTDARLGTVDERGGFAPFVPLLPDSPAIDSGDPTGCKDPSGSELVQDQRGLERVGEACDRGAVEKQPPAPLYFPQIAEGGGQASLEVLITSTANREDHGTIFFRDSMGDPLTLSIEGVVVDNLPFNIDSGGALSIQSDGTGDLENGYAFVESENGFSQINAILVYTINGVPTSVASAVPASRQHLFVERNEEVDSGLALANVSDELRSIRLLLLASDGSLEQEAEIVLEPGEHTARFIHQFFDGIPEDFRGSVQAISEGPFLLIGLRQNRGNLALTSLSSAEAAIDPGD